MPVAQSAARRHDRSPPVVGVLLGTPTGQQPQADGLLLVADEHAIGAGQRHPRPAGAQVDAEDDVAHGAASASRAVLLSSSRCEPPCEGSRLATRTPGTASRANAARAR